MKNSIIALWFLIGICSVANAQSAFSSDPCRYFVGLQTANNWYEVYYPYNRTIPNRIKISPWLVSAGYFIRSRLVLQVGFGYSADNFSSPGGIMIDSQGRKIIDDAFTDSNSQLMVPLLLRYSLTKRKPHLRAEALLGAVWTHNSFVQESHDELDGQVTRSLKRGDQANNFYVSAGLSVRYVFNRHFEALGDVVFNRNLHGASVDLHQQITDNRLGLTRSTNIGLRYRFNLRKPASPPKL